jgi:hypothetical protein
MAEALEKALAQVAQMPEEEQRRIGEWLLAELAAERAWNERFEKGRDMLAQMAKEALDEHARGETTDLNFEEH